MTRTFPFDPLTHSERAFDAARDTAELTGPTDGPQGFIIQPDVPLPGGYTIKRVVRLDDVGTGTSGRLRFKSSEADYAGQLGLTLKSNETVDVGSTVDRKRALDFWTRHAIAAGFPASVVEDVVASVVAAETSAPPRTVDAAARDSLSRQFSDVTRVLTAFLASLELKKLELPVVASNGSFTARSLDWSKLSTDADGPGTFYLIEEYRISSFATLYGLGKTVKSFSLLPGEETTIKVRTWRQREQSSSSKVSRTSSSGTSIIDSLDQSAVDRFSDQIQKTVSDKSTRASEENWHVEGQVSGTCGFASASVKASGGGEYRAGQEDFATRTATAVTEHTQQASASRKNTIDASTASSSSIDLTSIDRAEDENITERKLRNVNLRRVLNFVFRELNQRYDIFVHLVDVRIAFSNGKPASWNVVPPSQLTSLVESVCHVNRDLSLEGGGIVDTNLPLAARVSANILQALSRISDYRGEPVEILECVLESDDGQKAIAPLGAGSRFMLPVHQRRLQERGSETPAFNSYPVNVKVHYRFRNTLRDAKQVNGEPNVPGVVVSKTETVLRTDSIVVEALLGFSDALDAFAFQAQELGNEAKLRANELQKAEAEKLRVATELLSAIADPIARANAYAAMFARHADHTVKDE
jgi:hypothetical protein